MGELQAKYAYLAALLTRLYPHTQVSHPDQRKERALDYCEVRDRWAALRPGTPGVTVGLLDALGQSIRAKAAKWGVTISFGPATGNESPHECMADTLPPDDSILGTGAAALEDLVKTTGSLVTGMAKILPILLALNMLSNAKGVLDLFKGGRR